VAASVQCDNMPREQFPYNFLVANVARMLATCYEEVTSMKLLSWNLSFTGQQ